MKSSLDDATFYFKEMIHECHQNKLKLLFSENDLRVNEVKIIVLKRDLLLHNICYGKFYCLVFVRCHALVSIHA